MVMGDEPEAHPQKIEVNTSPLISDQTPEPTSIVENAANNHALQNLGRQSSIYSLTLDEFQHTLFESGKNFKSMNMDEFLNSIWTAEESQAHNPGQNGVTSNNYSNSGGDKARLIASGASSGRTIPKQPSLSRQGSLSLPPPLCRKTVDEVWSEIQKSQQQQQQPRQPPSNPAAEASSAHEREATFGEMTLEDFLVKAGVVREHCPTPNIPSQQPPPPQQQHQYALYQNTNNPQAGLADNRTFMGIGAGTMPAYPGMPPNSGIIGEPSGKGNNGYPAMPLTNIPYGGRVVNGSTATAGGYGPGLALGSPVSPLSSDGVCGPSQVDNSVNPYGFDMGAIRGRKRPMDGPVEKVVERRQRRMIKNRESAARSRARKQAYTVELEAELNQLREENAQLKQAVAEQAELEMQRKQQEYLEEQQKMARTRAQKARDKLSMMRRARSFPL